MVIPAHRYCHPALSHIGATAPRRRHLNATGSRHSADPRWPFSGALRAGDPAGKEAALSALLNLEPRLAGTATVEPAVEFTAERWVDLHDRARCVISVHTRTRVC